MRKLLTILLFFSELNIYAQQKEQVIKLSKVNDNEYKINPESISNLNKPIRLKIDKSVGNNFSEPSLIIFKGSNSLSPKLTENSKNPFFFDALKNAERNSDSILLQITVERVLKSFVIYKKKIDWETSAIMADDQEKNITLPTNSVLEPGNLIYDAIRLASPDIHRKEIFKRINFYYGSSDTSGITLDTLNNLFLRDYVRPDSNHSAQGTLNRNVSFQSIFTKIGGLDVTGLADGLAKFLVARTKQELSIAFFTKFKDEMALPQYEDLRILFPYTYKALQIIDKEIYLFDAYKLALKETFEKDLKNILIKFPTVISDGRFKDWFLRHPELKATILSGMYIYNNLTAGKHPGDVLAEFPVDEYLNPINNVTLKGIVQTVQLVSSALKSANDKNYWTTSDSLKMVFDDKNINARNAFMGLLWAKAKDINFLDSTSKPFSTLTKCINEIHGKPDSLKKYWIFLENVVNKSHDLQTTLSALKQKKEAERSSFLYEDYYGFINQSLDFIKKLAEFTRLPYVSRLAIPEQKINKYIDRAKTVNELGLDITTRNYASAIVNVTDLYDNITSLMRQDKSTTAGDIADDNLIIKKILKYGTMIAGVATAKNSDEVQKAIESVAMPAGSARVKRESISNIALNAFVGLQAGHEFIKNVPNKKWINTIGITAPVGVSIAWGRAGRVGEKRKTKGNKIIGGKCSGVFVSLIDLGAITTFRFGDTTTSKLPKIELKDIISPGIFYSLGFGKCPISMNIGGQYGPFLREVIPAKATPLNSGYLRISISFLVDIPLLNLYDKN